MGICKVSILNYIMSIIYTQNEHTAAQAEINAIIPRGPLHMATKQTSNIKSLRENILALIVRLLVGINKAPK